MSPTQPETLREYLWQLDAKLAETADMLWKLAEPIHDRSNRPDSNENGYPHALQVEKYAWKLIREAKRVEDFSALDLFLLSCGACCHDFDKGLESALEGKPAHGVASQQHVEGGQLDILLSGPVRFAIGDIISLHDLKVNDFMEQIAAINDECAIEENTIDLQRLAVLLKTGDILHTDASRVPRVGVNVANLPEDKRSKYRARACISGWKVEGAKVVLMARPSSDEDADAVREAHRFMCQEEWPAVEERLDNMHFPHMLYLTIQQTGKPDVHYPPPPVPTPLNLRQISEPVRDFVGRDEEIKRLLAAFKGAGKGAVISGVRGMGGVGKTELAKVLAKRLKKRFPDGQISFNLRGASDDESVKPATAAEASQHVIRSFHPGARLPEDVDQLQGIYHSVFDGKRALLLMDNALNAQQLAALVPPPDGCGLMVTSRHRFALPGMMEIDLDTLSPEEAQQLLLEICPRIGGHANALAAQCGHLPLALRLAASALKTRPTLGVEDYLKDLGTEQRRLATLDAYKDWTNEARGIEASLAISYRLLDKRLQRLWRALSVFPGGFDAAAAGSVWQLKEEKETGKALGDLYGASIVQWDEATGRFRLHELARDYARARAQENEKDRATDAQHHAAHYAAVLWKADELYLEGGDAILQGLALFDGEWGNIRAGQAWAAAHWEADKNAAQLCSDYPGAGVYCLSLRLHSRDRITWLETAVKAARKLKDRSAEGNHLGNLGHAYAELGETHKAIRIYAEQLAIVRKIGDRRAEGADLGNLGLAYARLGETHKAIGYFKQDLDIARKIGDRRSEATALGNLGNAYCRLGETRKAIESYELALVIDREIGDRRGEGADLGNLGLAYADLGETRKAIEYHEQALVIDREIGDRRGEGIALHNLAGALAKTGRRDEAIANAEQAVKIFEQIESPHAADARARLEELRK